MLRAIVRCGEGEPLEVFAAGWENRGFGGVG